MQPHALVCIVLSFYSFVIVVALHTRDMHA